jgi:hypothetical protein
MLSRARHVPRRVVMDDGTDVFRQRNGLRYLRQSLEERVPGAGEFRRPVKLPAHGMLVHALTIHDLRTFGYRPSYGRHGLSACQAVGHLLHQCFESADYHVTEARDCVAALQSIADAHPDLVVTEMMMPVMAGPGTHHAVARRASDLRHSHPGSDQ